MVAAFYKFIQLSDPVAVQRDLQKACESAGILGTILIAHEGINGTVCASREGICALMAHFADSPYFSDIQPKYSFAEEPAFYRMKVRLKREIVTMGQPDIDPENSVGTYVSPQDWNALISASDTLVIDTRNRYEVAIGTFENAVDPETASFRDFPAWIENYMADLPEEKLPKNIAMFCTGGIRCEKATSYLRARGYENVFHLEGGILKYLETMPAEDSAWRGECFVFDQRVSVKYGLAPGAYDQCHACRTPLTQEDKQRASFEHGVSCMHCIDAHDDADRARFRERQKQIRLSKERGQAHIGKAARR
ncbi:MAG: rhodanese-related sulfurtransferase [Pseudomonadota bacterium]|nr:rhodanese-related sulfurtransferase [Pseudomonadota bacterium]